MTRRQLNQLASIFGWSFLVCVGLQLFALTMYLLLREAALGPNLPLAWMFPLLDATELQRNANGFMTLLKILGLTFFLTPWLGLKIAAARAKE